MREEQPAPTVAGVSEGSWDLDAHARLSGLRLRAALLGAGLALAGLAAWYLLQAPLTTLVSSVWQFVLGQGALPAAHVPSVIDDAGWQSLMERGLVGVVLAGTLMGHAYGKTGTLRGSWLLAPVVLLVLVLIWLSSPTRNTWNLVPGPLERDILLGRYPAAEERLLGLVNAGAASTLRHYVLAQVALRTGEASQLASAGGEMLAIVDKVVYGRAQSDDLNIGLHYRPEVVRAVDQALNGEPLTEVGMSQPGALDSGQGQAGGARLVPGGVLLAAAGALWRLWLQMCERIRSVAGQLEVNATQRVLASLRTSSTARSVPLQAPAPAPLFTWRRVLRGLLLMPVLLVSCTFLKMLPDAFRGSTVSLPEDEKQPCLLVGTWSSSHKDAVFKFELMEDGRWTAVPLAAGSYASKSYRGTWQVRAESHIEWTDDDDPQWKESNRILSLEADSFSLREADGQPSRFNRLEAPRNGRCAAPANAQ